MAIYQIGYMPDSNSILNDSNALKAEALKRLSLLEHGIGNLYFRRGQTTDSLQEMLKRIQGKTMRHDRLCIFEFSNNYSKLKSVSVQALSLVKVTLEPPMDISEALGERIRKGDYFPSNNDKEEKIEKIITQVQEITKHSGFWNNEKATGYVKFSTIANQANKLPGTILSELKKEAKERQDALGPKFFTHRSSHSTTLINAILDENMEALTTLQELTSSYTSSMSDIPSDKAPRPGLLGENENDPL